MRRAIPAMPSSPEPNSQIAAGTGTGAIEPEKLVDVVEVLLVNRFVNVVGDVN